MKYRDEAVASVERWAGFAADPRFGLWAAVERSFGILAGSVLLKPLPEGDGEVEIGWQFDPDGALVMAASCSRSSTRLARGLEVALS
jgi:hypothetical protein